MLGLIARSVPHPSLCGRVVAPALNHSKGTVRTPEAKPPARSIPFRFCHPDPGLAGDREICWGYCFFLPRLFIPGAFDRWELIQAQELHNQLRMKQNLQQLNSKISDITTWLKKTEAELETLKMAEPPSDIHEMELRVKQLKVRGRCGGKRDPERACGRSLCRTSRLHLSAV